MGTDLNTRASITSPFLLIVTVTTTVPSIPAFLARSGNLGTSLCSNCGFSVTAKHSYTSSSSSGGGGGAASTIFSKFISVSSIVTSSRASSSSVSTGMEGLEGGGGF